MWPVTGGGWNGASISGTTNRKKGQEAIMDPDPVREERRRLSLVKEEILLSVPAQPRSDQQYGKRT